jgi:hypothetical protein
MTATHEPKTTVVVPTIRENLIRTFLDAWRDEFAGAHVIVVEDNPEPTMALPDWPNVTHYSWRDIEQELGRDAWIIPRRTDCVRSFGYWQAWQDHGDMIVTLDDDCFPGRDGAQGFLARHWQRLEQGGETDAWQTTGTVVTRGVPYHTTTRRRTAVVNHGMWDGVPDYDAPTQLLEARMPHVFRWHDQTIPVGRYFPMCGMNLAFRPVVVPAMYFLLMGRDHAFDRFGDIWAGLFVKRICDHLGFAIQSGSPAVRHERASNVWQNLRKEAPGLELNETLWTAVDDVTLTGTTFASCYRQLVDALAEREVGGDWGRRLRTAAHLWTGLFAGYDTIHGVRALAERAPEEQPA